MGAIPFAFSVHHFINSVGADAGFAAIIGLAILVLLYFAQARETKSLREQNYDAAERVQQLELNVAALSRAQPSLGAMAARPAPAPAPAGFSRPATAAPFAAVPVAPAGVGAPALTAATRLIPAAEGTTVLTGVAAGTATAVSSPGVSERAPGPNADVATGPPPSTTAGGANGVAPERAPRPTGAGAGRPAAVSPPRRGAPARTRRSRASRGFLVAIGLLGVVAVVAVLLVVTSSGGSGHTASTAASTSNAPKPRHRTRPAPFQPASVTVAVLNGTATANLAHQIALRLGSAGFKQGTIATASDQTQTATVVGYLPGHRKDALAVAASLKLGSASVQPVDQSNQAVACPPPAACAANVIVTVGSDLAPTA
jgi:LytR cell envelope-related transcriptional attenuator